jgi:hypothetical protein
VDSALVAHRFESKLTVKNGQFCVRKPDNFVAGNDKIVRKNDLGMGMLWKQVWTVKVGQK